MISIWNEVVEEGVAFPQEKYLTKESGLSFFASQTYCGVAVDNDKVVGLYILHPNNIGKCGHISNASYAVSLAMAKEYVFKVMQFNAVVESNIHARHLYERLGFKQLGVIPDGFRLKDGSYVNICPYYHSL